jgi:hypothetical protein
MRWRCHLLPKRFPDASKSMTTVENSGDPDGWFTLPKRQYSCWHAAEMIWPDGIPCGITHNDITAMVRRWLHLNGRSDAKPTTVRRALTHYPRQRPQRIRVRRVS